MTLVDTAAAAASCAGGRKRLGKQVKEWGKETVSELTFLKAPRRATSLRPLDAPDELTASMPQHSGRVKTIARPLLARA